MKVSVIIQARVGSRRLPGKVLRKVLGKPLLSYQLERVKKSINIDEIIVATTGEVRDNEIAKLCEGLKISCFKGSENDVLERYYQAAIQVKADIVVRLTGDCPLIDPRIIDQVIDEYLRRVHEVDYVSNILKRTYPRGMDVEVFSIQTLEKAFQQGTTFADREHVTRYILTNPSTFNLFNIAHSEDFSQHRWTVDTREDFILVEKIIEKLYPIEPNFSMEDILELLDQHPEWRMINTHIQQKRD